MLILASYIPKVRHQWNGVRVADYNIFNSHYQSWRLTGLYVFCAVIFTAGFIVRELGAFDYEHLIKFIITTCLVYAAP